MYDKYSNRNTTCEIRNHLKSRLLNCVFRMTHEMLSFHSVFKILFVPTIFLLTIADIFGRFERYIRKYRPPRSRAQLEIQPNRPILQTGLIL